MLDNGSTGQASSRSPHASERRHLGAARLLRVRAARVEGAAGRDRARARRRAGDRDQRLCRCAASGCGSASSSARVYGCRGRCSTSSRDARLDDPAGVEDRDAVGDRRHDAEVVRDQDDRQVVLAAQAVEQPQDPRLHRHVERRRRLVGDQQLAAGRRARSRSRSAGASRPRTGAGTRAARRAGSGMRTSSSSSTARCSALAPAEAEVAPDVLGELPADRQHRMERRHRILEDHREVAPRDFAQLAGAACGAGRARRSGRSPPRRRRRAAARAARASTSSCRCRSRPRRRTPRPARRCSRRRRRPSRARRGVGSRTRRPSTSSRLTALSCERHAVRGSNTSRRLSPRKLNASTTVKIARPGNVPIHHHWKYCVPSATIDPHSAVGGCAPRPRNERPESSRIAFARSSVASTSTGPATFGSTSRNNRAPRAARRAGAPTARTPSRRPTARARARPARTTARRRRRSRAPRSAARGRARPRRPSRG